VSKNRRIVWDKNAVQYLQTAIKFIRKDSPQNAEKVKQQIMDSVTALADQPEKHPIDKYRINNDRSFRAFEVYKFRITYFVSDREIRIVRIRHTSQEPKDF
jgi:plasmid stabilization system protein ParE